MLKWIILAVVILALIALVLANIRVVPQSKAFVLEAGHFLRHLADRSACKNPVY